jgi:hypothetical protein
VKRRKPIDMIEVAYRVQGEPKWQPLVRWFERNQSLARKIGFWTWAIPVGLGLLCALLLER